VPPVAARSLAVWAVAAIVSTVAPAARAQLRPGQRAPLALLRIDPLGLDVERALRLEALFRAELERLTGAPLPSRTAIDAAIGRDAGLRGCTGDRDCLAVIGRRLGVKQIAVGNVGQLGDSYVVNLKLVDVDSQQEVRRISEPLRGDPDELIEAVRVAAYRLVAPEQLKGSIALLADVNGAAVTLDGKPVGMTPMRTLAGLDVGKHKLRVEAKGYTVFTGDVEVRFQKTSEVVVRMQAAPEIIAHGAGGLGRRPAPTPWYASPWAYVGAGAAAVILGVVIGSALSHDQVVDCTKDPNACMGH
jgi:PEGA domain-containing protein